jgi:hypothetical protein
LENHLTKKKQEKYLMESEGDLKCRVSIMNKI